MINYEWYMKNDKWWMMNDAWWMMNDKWWMMNEVSFGPEKEENEGWLQGWIHWIKNTCSIIYFETNEQII